MEFNTDIVDTEDKNNIDFSAFSRAGYIMPGTYQMQVRLNGEALGNEISVPFYERPAMGDVKSLPEACLPPELINQVGLTDAARKKVGMWHSGQCIDFRNLPGVQVSPDLTHSGVNLSVPQAWLEYSDASWLPLLVGMMVFLVCWSIITPVGR